MDYCRNIISKYIIGLDKVLLMLEDLKKGVMLEETPAIKM